MSEAPEMFVYRTGPPWGFLWLKCVEAVDLNQHCIGSLIGSREIVDPAAEYQRVTLDHPKAAAFYLCGVTSPYRWAGNGHLLAVRAPGEEHQVEARGFEVTLQGLRPVPEALGEGAVDWHHPKVNDRLFHSCRNWRAACWMHANLGLRDMPNPEKAWSKTATGSARRRGQQATQTRLI